jgi:hypothetical protein
MSQSGGEGVGTSLGHPPSDLRVQEGQGGDLVTALGKTSAGRHYYVWAVAMRSPVFLGASRGQK